MSLIFDRFPSIQKAIAFTEAVAQFEPDLTAQWYASAELAQHQDPFPGELTPPIVHVERPDSGDDGAIRRVRELGGTDTLATGDERETAIVDLAATFGGTFAGT